MPEMVPYYRPPPGPLREIASYLQGGVLAASHADHLLQQDLPWRLVAPHVQDEDWWLKQQVVAAPPLALPWRITAWDATLYLAAPGVSLYVDPGPSAPDPVALDPPDLIVATHAHHDHTARLGEYGDAFPHAPVVMTHHTASLLEFKGDPLLRACLKHRTTRLDMMRERAIGGVRVRLSPAGHLLGAAMVRIQLGDDAILITGDFASREVGGVPGAVWPQEACNLMLIESAGAQPNDLPVADPKANRLPFLHQVARALNDGKTRLVVQAYAMAQAQELFAAWHQASSAGAFPHLVARLAGFAADVSELYRQALPKAPGPWSSELRELTTDEIPANSLVIASGESQDTGFAGRLAAGLEQDPQGRVLRHLNVHTHASWGERMAWTVGVPCSTVAFYHGSPPSVQNRLSQMGKRTEWLREGEEWLTANEQ